MVGYLVWAAASAAAGFGGGYVRGGIVDCDCGGGKAGGGGRGGDGSSCSCVGCNGGDSVSCRLESACGVLRGGGGRGYFFLTGCLILWEPRGAKVLEPFALLRGHTLLSNAR